MVADFIDSLRPLFDCLTDGFCIADAQGRLLYANAAAGEMLGPAAQLAGETSICELLCGSLEGACGENAAGCPLKVPRGPENALVFKGSYRPSGRELRVRCLRVRQPSVERHLIIIEDVSALAEAGRLKAEWRQLLAHDLRDPLAVMFGALRSVEELGAGHALDSKDMRLIGDAVNCGRRLDALIERTLEAYAPGGGK
ncbi:MAG: PAS domain-containing protein [Elusimicrobiota bacterium]